MKKYIVKYKDSEKVFGEYNSRKEASDILMEYIYYFNDCSDGDYISPFDFVLEEVECKEAKEVITDFESARKYLVGKTNDVFGFAKKRFSESVVKIEKAEILIKELNQKHIEALVALNRLFTIAEACNKADNFVPDLSNWNQYKWYPWFKYDKDAAGFVYAFTDNERLYGTACIGSRLCFMTSERAAQFGKQFAHLYNKVFI